MKYLKTILLSLILFSNNYLVSQNTGITPENNSNVRVPLISQLDGNQVKLRWAPNKPDFWLSSIDKGYVILKKTANDLDNLANLEFNVIDTILPVGKEQWISEALLREDDKYFLITLECTYGDFHTDGLGNDFQSLLSKSDELTNRYAFLQLACDFSFEAALYSGLGYIDDVKNDSRYIEYTIIPLAEYHRGGMEVSNSVIDKEYVKPEYYISNSVKENDQSIDINWDRQQAGEKYTAYWIERKTQDGTYIRLNKEPYIHGLSSNPALHNKNINFRDSVENYIPYHYRLIGITPFGEEEVFVEDIYAMGRDKTPPEFNPSIHTAFINKTNVKISWEQSNSMDMGAYTVLKGTTLDGKYVNISDFLPKESESYIDTNANFIYSNYYKVLAIDTAGNIATSLPFQAIFLDTFPPDMPTGLKGEADSTGLVTLSWNRNKDLDILGYKIQFANDPDHEFSMITDGIHTDTVFQEKIALNTTTPAVYYKVFAVDRHHNYSDISPMLRIARPDTIRPLEPFFIDYKVTPDSVYFAWEPSASKDVVSQVLLRSTNGTIWEEYGDIGMEDSDIVITDSNEDYYYRVKVIDDSDNASISPSDLYIEVPRSFTLKGDIRLKVNLEDNKIILNWDSDIKEEALFEVYRSYNDGGFAKLKRDITALTFTDTRIGREGTYSYIIKAKIPGNNKTKYSNTEMITYTK